MALQVQAAQVGQAPPPPPLFIVTRSGDEWRVDDQDGDNWFKATMTAGPNQPPSSGWMVKDWDTSANRHVPDSTMTCSIRTPTPPCCLTLTLSGEAKELHGRLEGTYKDTGLVSMGRPVIVLFIDILCCCDLFPCRSSSLRASSCLWQSGISTGASGRALWGRPPS